MRIGGVHVVTAAVVLGAIWFIFLRGRGGAAGLLPWNVGQAGSIFQGGLYGGGQ